MRNSFRKFYLGLNHGAKQDRNTRVLQVLYNILKALAWFQLIDETLSANLVYQSDYEIGSTTLSEDAMAKIMTMVMAW